MKMTTAEVARENYTFRQKRLLDLVQKGRAGADQYYDVSFNYRILGMQKLLMEADQQGYVDYLCKSGYARLFFLRDFTQKNQYDPIYVCVTKEIFFGTSLAAGHIDLAKDISRYSRDHHNPDYEYEDDFLFAHLLQQLVLEKLPQEKLKRILDRWEVVLEGASSIKFKVSKALVEKNQEDFESAFETLLIKRKEGMDEWKKSAKFDEELYCAEGYLYTEGICLLRVAEMRGIAIKDEYPLIPRMALRLDGVTFPKEDSWRVM